MANPSFPRTTVAGVSLPRMLIGSNWILGYSHTSVAADHYIDSINRNKESIAQIAERFLAYDINAVMAPLCDNPVMESGLKIAEDRTGKGIIRIDTPVINVDDTAQGRREAQNTIQAAAKAGATFCLIHHSCVEQLVVKNLSAIPRLPDYLSMIRDAGMIPGLSAHMPEIILYSDANEYDVQTYIQLYNPMGFLMQVEIEQVIRIIHNAKKPVMSIKPMAAGRCSPYVGITFAYATLREQDMVTVGCMTPDEAEEDIEIGLAAIERRLPNLEGRSSPNKTAVLGGDNE